ncbi:34-kDa subunit of RNA polymerase III (C) [Lecanora helva]
MAAAVRMNESNSKEDVTMTEPSGVSSSKELKMALYSRCASMEENRLFDQEDLLSFNIIPNNDVHRLLVLTQQLAKEGLLKIMTKDGGICWRVIKKADAAKYKLLSQDEALVFSYIESAAREGIWSKLLRTKTNLHMTSMNRAIKSLENKNLIKSIKTIKFPSRKTYILAKLQPSEDVTGGPFYTEGVLDEEFIHIMSHWTEKYILGRSWWFPPQPEPNKKKSRSKVTMDEAMRLRNEAFQRTRPSKDNNHMMKPFPPSYTKYPTLSEITGAINDSKISGVVMKESEMKQLLDILRWDGRIEKILESNAYRATRIVPEDNEFALENGLTESPCGRCPVFDICEEDGPVNARSCEYFQEWLQI